MRKLLEIPGKRGVLSTIKRDGRPQMSVVIHHFDPATSTLSISVTDDRAKTRNLRRDPRASYLVTGRTPWDYVVAEGTAEFGPLATEPDDCGADELVDLYTGRWPANTTTGTTIARPWCARSDWSFGST